MEQLLKSAVPPTQLEPALYLYTVNVLYGTYVIVA